MTTRMTSNDIEALAVMVEVFGTQQLLDALEAIAICRALHSGGAPLNSVQARINRAQNASSTCPKALFANQVAEVKTQIQKLSVPPLVVELLRVLKGYGL